MIQKDDSIKILVKMEGNIPVPVYLKINGNNSEKIINKSAAVWSGGSNEIWLNEKIDFQYKNIELGNSKIPDINKSNNYYDSSLIHNNYGKAR